MDYGSIIKRAWRMTWRYKALWVLGIFAGVSGCQGGGSSSSPNTSQWSGGSSDFGGLGAPNLGGLERSFEQLVPMLVAGAFLVLLLALVMGVLGLAARGGLVVGASAYEEGRRPGLGELWGAGFRRFWTLVGLDIILRLPILAVALLIAVLVIVPLVGAIDGGGEPSAAFAVPVCGSLAIGVPILLIMSFVLGIMYLVALRYVMLGGQGAFEASGNSWRFLRARFKDTLLIWLINAGLNLVASFAIAIPFVIIGVGVAIPLAVTAGGEAWGAFAGLIALLIVLVLAVAFAYNAVWGTFTSALWTCFFRDVAGMPGVEPDAVGVPDAFGNPPYPPAGFPPEPPAPPSPPVDTGGSQFPPPAAPPPMAPGPPTDV